jgi:Na+-transporting NADH:ubiquinone oxidoreductase subunit C
MDTNKNSYTVIYATVLVVFVAVVLALASYLLKDRQQRNVAIETKQMILKSVKLGMDAETAPDKASYIEEQYAKYITDTTVTAEAGNLNLFICTMDSGEKMYIVPVHGTGLWGPIWGYVALKGDFSTIYGTTYDHKSETPGLGAEINTPVFNQQFEGKQIFKDGKFVSVMVVKGGANPESTNEVDAISGGTITSKAVEAMLQSSISEYLAFFKAKLEEAAKATPAPADSTVSATADSTGTAVQTQLN